MNKNIYVVAGGTGGHINAAQSIGSFFNARGFEARYLTGVRYLDYQLFKSYDDKVMHLDAQPLRAAGFLKQIKSLTLNIFVFLTCIAIFLRRRPMAVIGCGGYVCGPCLAAAKLLFIKIYILEQNAVAGFTNRVLSHIADKVFINFAKTRGLNATNIVQTGNPIRSNITYTEPRAISPYRILVFGGSLGAKQLNGALKLIVEQGIGHEIEVHHQVGKDNTFETTVHQSVTYNQVQYIEDMAKEYRWADIIIARAGASTISELRIARRPSILVPYPFATDNHQEYNAKQLHEESKFHVAVKDPLQQQDDLAKDIGDELLNIITNKLFIPYGEYVSFDPCEIIFREVVKNVRD